VDVTRIAEGLWRWTGRHEEWKDDVGCVYLESADGVCLFDPLVPPEDAERFWSALDRDVEKLNGRVHVLITVHYHARSAREIVGRYGAELWAPLRARAAVERRAGRVDHAFRPGDRLPAGIEALPSGRRTEVLYLLAEQRALVPGDVLLGDDSGGLRLCPRSWLPASVDLDEVRASLRPLLDLDLDRVLVSHGSPVLSAGTDALAKALA
jgi:glyoxylase-like metal-dependent hydrolase (beta-lactamase superfamily II)